MHQLEKRLIAGNLAVALVIGVMYLFSAPIAPEQEAIASNESGPSEQPISAELADAARSFDVPSLPHSSPLPKQTTAVATPDPVVLYAALPVVVTHPKPRADAPGRELLVELVGSKPDLSLLREELNLDERAHVSTRNLTTLAALEPMPDRPIISKPPPTHTVPTHSLANVPIESETSVPAPQVPLIIRHDLSAQAHWLPHVTDIKPAASQVRTVSCRERVKVLKGAIGHPNYADEVLVCKEEGRLTLRLNWATTNMCAQTLTFDAKEVVGTRVVKSRYPDQTDAIAIHVGEKTVLAHCTDGQWAQRTVGRSESSSNWWALAKK